MREPEDRWEPGWVDVIHGDGPMRIYDDKPAPETRVRRTIGFTPPPESEPLTWEGDGA